MRLAVRPAARWTATASCKPCKRRRKAVMRLANGQTAQQTDANLLAGLKNLSGLSTLNSTQLDLVKAAIAAATDDGSAVDSVTELQGVMQKAMALQTLKNYSVSNSNSTPTLADYQNAGLKAFDNLSTENRAPTSARAVRLS